jgi:hypothetical protein
MPPMLWRECDASASAAPSAARAHAQWPSLRLGIKAPAHLSWRAELHLDWRSLRDRPRVQEVPDLGVGESEQTGHHLDGVLAEHRRTPHRLSRDR